MGIQVRVTQEPDVVRVVDEREFTDLRLQGLLLSHEHVEGYDSPNPWVEPETADEVAPEPGPGITDPEAPGEPAEKAGTKQKKGGA